MDSLREAFNELNSSLKEANKVASKYRDALCALRKLCQHDWKCVGRDSHKEHYECSICGETDEW